MEEDWSTQKIHRFKPLPSYPSGEVFGVGHRRRTKSEERRRHRRRFGVGLSYLQKIRKGIFIKLALIASIPRQDCYF